MYKLIDKKQCWCNLLHFPVWFISPANN